MENSLYIVRGIPGSGKSTFAKSLGGSHFESDMYFMQDGKYNFDPEKLKEAHNWCRHSVMDAMKLGTPKIVVSNTFTQKWEIEPYFILAEELGYRVFSIIVENRHGGRNVHDVPESVLTKMKDRFEISL